MQRTSDNQLSFTPQTERAYLSCPQRLLRFFKFSLVGTSAFALDLSIIAILHELLTVPFTAAVLTGALIGFTVSYVANRHYTFKGTKRGFMSGYAYFMGFAALAVGTITLGTTALISLGLGGYTARILISCIVGIANFLLNSFFNFKIW